MNKIIETIKNRRSTRKFTKEVVDRNSLESIIEAGTWAPSGVNKQSWHFTVVQDQNLLKQLNIASKEAALSSQFDYIRNLGSKDDYDSFYGAGTVIIVSSTQDSLSPIMDISAATQNMLLAAESLGFGTCWVGMISVLFQNMPNHNIIKSLNLPEGVTPSHAIIIGYKDATSSPTTRRENVVQYL